MEIKTTSNKRGGKRPGAGRPKRPGQERLQVWARIRPELYAKLLQRAYKAKLNVSRTIEQLLEMVL